MKLAGAVARVGGVGECSWQIDDHDSSAAQELEGEMLNLLLEQVSLCIRGVCT